MVENKENIKLELPSYCCIALLESCFMKCKMCYKWKNDVNQRFQEEPSLEQWKDFLEGLGRLCREKTQINFAGGEPLAREETINLLSYASRLGFYTHLATNAYLIDKQKAKMLAESGLKSIAISLDSADEDTHDFLRGTKGSFKKAVEAVDLLHEHDRNLKITLCTVISAVNLTKIPRLVQWTADNGKIEGIGFQAVTQPFSTPEDINWYKNPEFEFLWPKDINLVTEVMESLISIKNKNYYADNFQVFNPADQFRVFIEYFKNPQKFIKQDACHIDERAINITPTGDVRICFYKPSIGNIKTADIKQIWFSDEADIVRKQIKSCRRNCQALVNCNFDEKESYVS